MDVQPRTVLVGLDGSESAWAALAWAVDRAVREGWAVELVNAEPASATFGDATVVTSVEAVSVLRGRAMEILDAGRDRVDRLAPGLVVTTAYEVDDVRSALLRRSAAAAMVVVGSHGRGPVRTLVLGSVGIWLVKHARCPVVVHRPGTSAGHSGGVVVAADALAESQPVLAAAWHQAELAGLPLTVLHCLGGGPFALGPRPSDSDLEARNEEARLSLAEGTAGMAERHPDVVVGTRVVRGTPVEALADLGAEPDLLVVGAHQRSLVRQLAHGVGSTALAVVEHATCPVMIVPVGGAAPPAVGPTEGRRVEAVPS